MHQSIPISHIGPSKYYSHRMINNDYDNYEYSEIALSYNFIASTVNFNVSMATYPWWFVFSDTNSNIYVSS